jgi:hypothetical protein
MAVEKGEENGIDDVEDMIPNVGVQTRELKFSATTENHERFGFQSAQEYRCSTY